MTPEELKKIKRQANLETIYCGLGAAGILIFLFILEKYILGGQFIGNLIIEIPALYCGIIGIVFTLFTSKLEAYYYTHEINDSEPDNFNEHPLFMMIRLCVIIPLWILTSWDIILCYMGMFPFIHDGNYYRWRHKLNPDIYTKTWFAQSTTSTAWSTKFLTPVIRTSLFIVSVVILFILISNQ